MFVGSDVGSSRFSLCWVSDAAAHTILALVDGFLELCETDGKELKTPEEVDECMVRALTDMYFEGRDIGVGTKLVAGWMACFPRFGSAGDLKMPRSWGALKGWRRLAPPRSRVGAVLFVVRSRHRRDAREERPHRHGAVDPPRVRRLPLVEHQHATQTRKPDPPGTQPDGVLDRSAQPVRVLREVQDGRGGRVRDVGCARAAVDEARLRADATGRQDAEGLELQLPGGRQTDRCSRRAARVGVRSVPAPALRPELGPAEGKANAEGDPEAGTLGKLLQ